MNARLLGLLLGLAALAALGPRWVLAQGQSKQDILPTFQSEGRDPVYFSTSCVSGSWVQMMSSDTISRSTLVQAVSANTADVCVSSGPVNNNTCAAATPGDQLPAGSALTIYHRASLFCRSVSGTQTLKGHRNRDHSDYGQTGVP